MFEKILGPSVRYNQKTGKGIIKLRGGQTLGIKLEDQKQKQVL